jgi:hypothetical protein
VFLYEEPGTEHEYLRMSATWSLDGETAGLITSSTVTATPLNPGPPVLTATVGGAGTSAYLGPVAPNTAYAVTVTSTDAEGTSEPSAPFDLSSPNGDGEGEKTTGGTGSEVCEAATGTIKLSPGLSNTPHVQTITLKGQLSSCDGPAALESGSFVAHLKTTEEVTCSALESLSFAPTTEPLSAASRWAPREAGHSHGSLIVAITEAGGATLEGSLEGGPFPTPAAVAGTLYESFSGGPSCGLPQGSKKAKPVKTGSFSASGIELG